MLTSYPIPHFLTAALRCLLSPSIPIFPRCFALQEDGSLPLPSYACSSNLSRSCQECVLPVCPTVPSPLRFTALFAASTGSSLYFQLCTKRSGVPLEGTVHQEVLDPKACFHLIRFHCAGNVISAPLLSFLSPPANQW